MRIDILEKNLHIHLYFRSSSFIHLMCRTVFERQQRQCLWHYVIHAQFYKTSSAKSEGDILPLNQAETKWFEFSRRNFQIDYLVLKISSFDWNRTLASVNIKSAVFQIMDCQIMDFRRPGKSHPVSHLWTSVATYMCVIRFRWVKKSITT